jgi:hypothetical protein
MLEIAAKVSMRTPMASGGRDGIALNEIRARTIALWYRIH